LLLQHYLLIFYLISLLNTTIFKLVKKNECSSAGIHLSLVYHLPVLLAFCFGRWRSLIISLAAVTIDVNFVCWQNSLAPNASNFNRVGTDCVSIRELTPNSAKVENWNTLAYLLI
jgi:hypothetical protein